MNEGIVKDFWLDEKDTISEKIMELWKTPELPMMEYESCKTLKTWLAQEGFVVTDNYCGLPTSFKAVFGSGYPTIGILAEYDALAGLSNDAVPYRKTLNQAAGHACLHCHIGGGNSGAAIALSKYLKESGKRGTVVVVGCPAEELLWGKVALLGEGGFDGLDVLLTCHVDYQNAAVSRPTLSCISGEFLFRGISSHSGAARAHNALDGIELAIETVERMRGHQFPGSSVEHVIRNGGNMPNITPDSASVWFNIRDKDFETAKSVYEYVRNIVKECAEVSGVEAKEGFLGAAHGYLPNDTLGKLLYKHLKDVGEVRYTEEEIEWMEELSKNALGSDKVVSSPELQYLDTGVDPYSQDDGEASWHIPLGRVNWEIPSQIPLHNWCTSALAGKEMTVKGALMASHTLYLAAVDMINEPDIVKTAAEELEERTEGIEINKPMYGKEAFNVLTKNPALFWDGTWLEER